MTSETSRRALLRTAVWSAPVIALAVATPAQAASPEPTEAVTFSPALTLAPSAEQTLAVAGTAPGASRVVFGYPAGFGGPAGADVSDGSFVLRGVRCPVGQARGVITASAPGLAPGLVEVLVLAGQQNTGSITWSTDAVVGVPADAGWALPTLTGSISTRGDQRPDVALSYPLGYLGPATATVSWSTPSGTSSAIGGFTVSGVTALPGATWGGIEARPADYQGIVTYTPSVATIAVQLG